MPGRPRCRASTSAASSATTPGASHVPFVVRNDSGHSDAAVPDVRHDLAGLQHLRRQQPLHGHRPRHRRPRRRAGLQGQLQPAHHRAGDHARGQSLQRRVPDAAVARAQRLRHELHDRRRHRPLGRRAARAPGVHVGRPRRVLVRAAAGQRRSCPRRRRRTWPSSAATRCFWKTRWESSIDGSGTSHRTLVSYKETHNYPNNPDPSTEWTGTWRDPRDPQSVQPARERPHRHHLHGQLLHVRHGRARPGRRDPLLAQLVGRARRVPDTLGSGILGYEWDEDLDNGFRPANEIRMSRTTHAVTETLAPGDYGSTYVPGTATHSLTLYKAASGALVFGAGTVQWAWGLDDDHDRGSDPAIPAVQQATVNLFSDMGVTPATPADRRGRHRSEHRHHRADRRRSRRRPAARRSRPARSRCTAPRRTSVAPSVPSRSRPTPAPRGTRPRGGRSWSYSFAAGAAGTTRTVQVRAVDDSFNVGATSSVTFTVGPAPCARARSSRRTCRTPSASNDGQALEVGVKVRMADDRHPQRRPAVQGHAEPDARSPATSTRPTGALLASTAPTSVSGSGWQSPAAHLARSGSAPDTTYVIIVLLAVGRLRGSRRAAWPPRSRTRRCRALADGIEGPNGVFRYGGGFPTSGSAASNYWVDVAFTPGTDRRHHRTDDRQPHTGAIGHAGGDHLARDRSTSARRWIRPRSAAPPSCSSDRQSVPCRRRWPTTPAPGPRRSPLQRRSATRPATRSTCSGGAGGAKDVAGNPLATDVTWGFRTIGLPPDVGPGRSHRGDHQLG